MDRYNKLTIIGKGTFGSAWLVESKQSGKQYAVKELRVVTMPTADRHLVLNEVKILSNLKHKNIIRYKDAFEESCVFYIVMEYAEGGDLYTKIKQSKTLFTQEKILDWFTQLLLALKHIHGQNILHRDLKTQNIFLTSSDVIKLGDFGIARILDSTTDHAQTTVGTPYYLSPEICQRQPYNQKSDMWALGCVIYEVASLTHPFIADCFSSLVVKILHGKYPPIPRVYGPLLEDLITVLLRTNPEDRPSAKQLIYVPAMKQYVEKYAVIQRQRVDSTASTASERCVAKQPDWAKQNDAGCEASRTRKTGQERAVKETKPKLCVPGHIQEIRESHDQKPAVFKDARSKDSQLREKVQSMDENRRAFLQKVPVTVHHERKTVSVSSVKDKNLQPVVRKQILERRGIVGKEKIPSESSAFESVRLSILKEHESRRRSSASCASSAQDVGINSRRATANKTKLKRTERVYSEMTQPTVNEADVKIDHCKDKETPRVLEERSTKVDMKSKAPQSRAQSCNGIAHIDEKRKTVSFRKGDFDKEQHKSCASCTHEGSAERHVNETHDGCSTTEHKNVAQVKNDKQTTSMSNDKTTTTNAPQAQSTSQRNKQSIRPGIPVTKSRDRVVSSPCVGEVRARRRAARESLNYHVYHCRRMSHRTNPRRFSSHDNLDKENLYPRTRQLSAFKVVPRRKAVLNPPSNEQQNLMVSPSPDFKRCQTYKVAQLRRIPLISVPDASEITKAEVPTESRQRGQPAVSERRSSESVFYNPKTTISKLKNLKGVQIEKARRRTKKLSREGEVGSSRREFSFSPEDKVKATSQSQPRTQPPKMKNIQPCCAKIATSCIEMNPGKTTKSNACAKNISKLKFKFQGETLHLNATDSNSAFAHMEALREFLENNLGTKRFVEAYRHLSNTSTAASDNDERLRSDILDILGVNNTEYLPLLHQLIASETNHFGTSV